MRAAEGTVLGCALVFCKEGVPEHRGGHEERGWDGGEQVILLASRARDGKVERSDLKSSVRKTKERLSDRHDCTSIIVANAPARQDHTPWRRRARTMTERGTGRCR